MTQRCIRISSILDELVRCGCIYLFQPVRQLVSVLGHDNMLIFLKIFGHLWQFFTNFNMFLKHVTACDNWFADFGICCQFCIFLFCTKSKRLQKGQHSQYLWIFYFLSCMEPTLQKPCVKQERTSNTAPKSLVFLEHKLCLHKAQAHLGKEQWWELERRQMWGAQQAHPRWRRCGCTSVP